MRIGADLDGCLVDFNTKFIERVVEVTGKDLFPPRPFDIPTWDYPQHYGYTGEEVSCVWRSITEDRFFWETLPPYTDTHSALMGLSRRPYEDDLYFITGRPGVNAKRQTERWLRKHWPVITWETSTVLISSHKGLCAQALKLNVYIDDYWKNVMEVAQTPTKTYLLDRPWNRPFHAHAKQEGIVVVPTFQAFLDDLPK